MNTPLRGLDHLVIAVADLDTAMARYQSLGFTTTPRALHPWGTANSLVQFKRNFLELLSVEHPERIAATGRGEFGFGDFNRRFLERHQGMSMLVFSSTDAAADLAHWRDMGLTTYAPFDFSRSATLPDGGQVQVAFSLGFVTHPRMPWAGWFVCQQHHPENFWKPRYQQHPNDTRCLQSVIMAAPEPARYREFLAALFPEGKVVDEEGGVCLALPDGDVLVLEPQRVSSLIPGFGDPAPDDGPRFVAAVFQVDDGQHLRRCLDAASVTGQDNAGTLWIPASVNEGLALGFRVA